MNLDSFKDKQNDILDKLFRSDEIQDIKSSRRKFQDDINKTSNKTNDKKNYFAYIKYEISLWKKIVAITPNSNYLQPFEKWIINLHILALKKHSDFLPFWLSYIKFCMESNFTDILSEIFTQMLTYHTAENLWLLASKWELDEHDNIEMALEHLRRALSYHSKSSTIYCEIFRLELQASKHQSADSANTQHSEIEIEEKVIKLFKTIQSEIPKDVNSYLNLFKMASKYSFTTKLQTIIAISMVENFSETEEVWDILAKQELEGHHLSKNNVYKFIPASSLDVRLQNLIKKYKHALEFIKTETMWTKYLNTLFELQEDKKYDTQFLKKTIMDGCTNAHCLKLLSEDIYLKWIEQLHGEELLKVLEQATEEKPKCLPLWVARIRYHICNSTTDTPMDMEIEKVFDKAIEILGENSIQIWRLKIQYHQVHLKSGNPVIESIYRAGLKQSPTVSKLLKPQYLEWLVLFKSTDRYEEYEKIAKEEPWCIDVHKKMVELEAMCPQPNEKTLELVSKLAIQQFGKDAWMEYLYEETSCGPQWKRSVFKKYLLKPSS